MNAFNFTVLYLYSEVIGGAPFLFVSIPLSFYFLVYKYICVTYRRTKDH